MSKDANLVSLSTIDEEFFGVKTAKVVGLRQEDILEVLNYCETNHVKFLIARCSTTDLQTVQEMERLGFLIMDTLIYFSCSTRAKPTSVDDFEFQVRAFRPGEEDIIKSVAAEAFQGYLGHYHADSRLDAKKCDEVYTDWAYRSCLSKDFADQVLVVHLYRNIIGFGAMRINKQNEGELHLSGVVPSFQGRGVHRLIVKSFMNWCFEKGLEQMVISTQITNLASQKVWIRLGFEPRHTYYTFHKWFDQQGRKDLRY